MKPIDKKRQADFQIIAHWVNEGDRVLDLGCGRGVLLEYLKQKKSIYGVGVDIDLDKILSCVKRGVPAYQGDIRSMLATFPDDAFDRVIFSRTVEQLDDADAVLAEGLRVGRRVAVGFVNKAFWLNRLNVLFKGRRTVNEVYPKPWYESMPTNPFSVAEFEDYCDARRIVIEDKVYLSGDWRSECSKFPNLMAGYAIYDLASID
ncbi:methionine biosynthesis protein MetW [Coraliomargarita sp. SDUM461003]|uniref:Methionine biosynthesis protein MetW n=1 Tax=Thalassobacterium maritimum TaxID=3041265 RepID=A0ABU1AS55_9BACT|nr:methionine biosynthesis protein MetW [Coraliomargarita sp. SDUM461003]MBT65194.1 methionine biosynthesis protein MetW [Puniceicoccaceae bacterium]MDQ8206989.1 methionine biosynthesis protein MetW [Coraliomargarita sp. SDUM461003]HBR94305.1 methionine biosynthesis protein MetW [Opitutae bacterium]|tara:strand:- start:1868 stop:2479 length:612 start_codon:yes stop_codon:yes gene_type:complete